MRWLLLLSVMLVAACSGGKFIGLRNAGNITDIHNPELRIDLPTNIERVRKAISDAADFAGWTAEQDGPGRMTLTKRERGRAARVAVDYSAEHYRITYVSSVRLGETGNNRIHRRYGIWISELVNQIDNHIERSP